MPGSVLGPSPLSVTVQDYRRYINHNTYKFGDNNVQPLVFKSKLNIKINTYDSRTDIRQSGAL